MPSIGAGATDYRTGVDARLHPQVPYLCHTPTPVYDPITGYAMEGTELAAHPDPKSLTANDRLPARVLTVSVAELQPRHKAFYPSPPTHSAHTTHKPPTHHPTLTHTRPRPDRTPT